MDKYKLLYQNSKGVRKVADLDISDRIQVIGVTRYTHFETPQTADWDMNGNYPIIDDDMFKDVFGKVLTIIDASFVDGNQKEAFKSLVKSTMSDWYNKNVNYVAKMTEQATHE